MSRVQDVYRAMLRDRVAPSLRSLGLKGSGMRYRIDDVGCWALLGFQSSMYNTADAMRFTINLLVVSKLVWQSARRERPHLPEKPSPGVYYGTFTWSMRIGHLLPENRDVWWEMGLRTNPASIADEVVAAIRDYGLPAMRSRL